MAFLKQEPGLRAVCTMWIFRCNGAFSSFGSGLCCSVGHLLSGALVRTAGHSQVRVSSEPVLICTFNCTILEPFGFEVLLLGFAVSSQFCHTECINSCLKICFPFPDHPRPVSSTGSGQNLVRCFCENWGQFSHRKTQDQFGKDPTWSRGREPL